MVSLSLCSILPSLLQLQLVRPSHVASQAERWVRSPMMMRRPLFLMKSKAFWSVTAILLVSLVVGLVVWGIDPDPNQFLAAASTNDSAVRIDGVSCLSIDPNKVVFDQKDYWDPKLVEAIVDTLSIKAVLFNADYATCPWGFSVTVVPRTIPAVRYNGQFARYLVSIGICERTPDGRMNPNKCLSKNIYVFNPRVEPHELFSLALVGLARPQASELEAFQSKRPQ
jgi:hypothetical protein